jgi:hypothetical protein
MCQPPIFSREEAIQISREEAIQLIAGRLAAAGHPRTIKDDLEEAAKRANPPDFKRELLSVKAATLGAVSLWPEAPSIYERAAIDLDRVVASGEIRMTGGLVRVSEIDCLWPPPAADGVPPGAAAIDSRSGTPGVLPSNNPADLEAMVKAELRRQGQTTGVLWVYREIKKVASDVTYKKVDAMLQKIRGKQPVHRPRIRPQNKVPTRTPEPGR